MPWNMNDYPSSLKNLNKATRKKAIDIANDLLNDGHDEGRAIPIATSQAKSWYDNASKEEINHYLKYGKPTNDDHDDHSNPALLDQPEMVVPHEDGWAVQSRDAKKPYKVFSKKEEAIDEAKKRAKNQGTGLKVFDEQEQIQERRSYDK